MSSSISPADVSSFVKTGTSSQSRDVDAGKQVQQKETDDLGILAENSSPDEVGVTKTKSESGDALLSNSLEKLFGEESTLSLIQSRSLEFSVGEYNSQTVVKVIDKGSQDVIRQIPSDEFIKMAQRIDMLSDEMQKARGVLLDKQV